MRFVGLFLLMVAGWGFTASAQEGKRDKRFVTVVVEDIDNQAYADMNTQLTQYYVVQAGYYAELVQFKHARVPAGYLLKQVPRHNGDFSWEVVSRKLYDSRTEAQKEAKRLKTKYKIHDAFVKVIYLASEK